MTSDYYQVVVKDDSTSPVSYVLTTHGGSNYSFTTGFTSDHLSGASANDTSTLIRSSVYRKTDGEIRVIVQGLVPDRVYKAMSYHHSTVLPADEDDTCVLDSPFAPAVDQ